MGNQERPNQAPGSDSDLINFARQQAQGVGSSAESDLALGGNKEHEPFDAPPPDSFTGYRILNEIHRGGQGVVYQAFQESTERKVAIKVMKEGPFAGSSDKARFDREVHVLGQLNHPNIVAIHDTGVAAGCHYFVMDYISGQSLDTYMAGGDHPIDQTLKLFGKICEAVNAAHLRGVIHRDLKPGNIRIDENSEPYVLDFGLAKVATGDAEASAMTMTGQFVGSLPWASPEQAEGVPSKIDLRTDVYSLGVVCYQMLTGRFPYEVIGNMRDVVDRILQAEPSRPSTIRKQINDEVETIVLKCLSKERDRRYQTAGELARDVGHYLAGEPIEAKRDSGGYVLRKQLKRYRIPAVIAVVFMLVVAVGLAASLTFWGQAVRERDRAEEVAGFTQEMLSGIGPEVAGGMDKKLLRLILDNAAGRIERELGDQPDVAASLRATIGNTYRAIGEYELAGPHLGEALRLRTELFGEEHRDTLDSMSDMAGLYYDQNHYDKAEPLLEKTLDIRRRELGEEDPDTLESMSALAMLLYNVWGRFDEGERLLERVLETQRLTLADGHPDMLPTMNNLGLL